MTNKWDTKSYQKPVTCPPGAPICADCEPPKHPCPQSAIIRCCTGTGLTSGFIRTPLFPPPATPVPVVCTPLDTTCLCRPIVNITFNCNVHFTISEDETFSIVFQLKKSCDNGLEVVCGTWTVARNALLSLFPDDSFTFTYCDRHPCPGCCVYTVEIVSFEVGENLPSILSVNAPALKVIATETCDVSKGNISSNPSLRGTATKIYDPREMKCPPAAPVCADCEPKHPCPQGALFNCCTGAGIPPTDICPAVPLSLVCVTIDTTCLCRPLVILDFSAIIATANENDSITTLGFRLKKSCDNGQEIECGNWTFQRAPAGFLTASDTFRFTFCDCDPCPGCCTYSVVLASCNINAINGGQIRNFSINTPTAAVWAVDTCPQSS